MNTETVAPPPAIVNGHALVTLDERQNYSLPMPIQIDRIIERVKAVKEIVNRAFEDGLHFGKIPGTGDKKTLLKPGFDTLCLAFQFSPKYVKQEASIERGDFINLIYECQLIHIETGRVIATGQGSCNSKEEKYRWTTLGRKCPTCKKETILKSKDRPEWFCWAKKGGCGAKFKEGDPAVENQEVGRKENDNPWNFHNTLTKMAQKRAGMAAIITACGLSGDFTQDMEDFDPQAHDKRQRGEAGIDVQGQYEERRDEIPGADVYPWPGSEMPSGESADQRPAPPPVDEFSTFSRENPQTVPAAEPVLPLFESPPPPPNVNADVTKAYLEVCKELAACKTRDHFRKLKEWMQSSGINHVHPMIVNLYNSRYHQLFPAPPKPATAPKGA